MNLTRILSYVFFVVSLGLAYFLYDNINSTIEFKEAIVTTEKQITDKLAVIREAEKVYLEQFGHYTSNWDSLINFVQNGAVPITLRTEKITQLSYGEEKVEVQIDTIGFMPAKDRIFKKTHTVNATSNGVFLGFLAKSGDFVVKGSGAYRLRAEGKEKADVYNFTEQGTITSVANIAPSTEIKKGTTLYNLWDYVLNPSVDIKSLSLVPGSNGKLFDIFVGKIERNGSKVSVIEVKDPSPINPERKASNEAENRKPLGFGSRVDTKINGNWE
jgi:hypothetical protein